MITLQQEKIEDLLNQIVDSGRQSLFEHEVYALLSFMGLASTPKTVFVEAGGRLAVDDLEDFRGDQVVIKVVSPNITHKSDVGGVKFERKSINNVNATLAAIFTDAHLQRAGTIVGALVCEFIPYKAGVFGSELFVGLRATREFGPVLAAGLGGIDTEYYAANLKGNRATAMAPAFDISAEEFLDLFRRTSCYELLAGRARGHVRSADDSELRKCFAAFIELAKIYMSPQREGKKGIVELEVNPFAAIKGELVGLDGHCRLGHAPVASTPRPISKIDRLLHPRSIAVVGASAKSMNPGRVILRNIIGAEYNTSNVYVVKEGLTELDGVQCVESIDKLPKKVDVIVLAVAATQVPELAKTIIEKDACESVILIPGGLGETEGGKEAETQLRQRIAGAHTGPSGGPVFLGGNCLGIFSRPGGYDTLFIPKSKLPKNWNRKGKKVALISQSGAFMITRMSNLESLNPNYAISCGNQVDLTVADVVEHLLVSDAVDVFAVYVEGFADLGGLALAKHVRLAIEKGKEVVFYKAGRTQAGRTATAGHTASIAGDYAVCEAALKNAGALVADTFMEFEYYLNLCTALHGRKIGGTRIACTSNAGYETVGMADAISGPGYSVDLVPFDDTTTTKVEGILSEFRLDGLVNARPPLDLTPMATDAAHETCIRAMLDRDDVDAVVASYVPLTPAMKTTPDEVDHEDSMTKRMPKIFADTTKPVVVAIDSGPLYDPMAKQIEDAGIPVFRSADSAVRMLGKYLCSKRGMVCAAGR